MKELGYISYLTIFMFVSAAYSGFALSILWGWFIVPVFSLPKLSILTAIGLSMVASFLTQPYKYSEDNRDPDEKLKESSLSAFIKPTAALFIGWVVTLFM